MHRVAVLLTLIGVAAGNFYCSSPTNTYFCTSVGTADSQAYDCKTNALMSLCGTDKICAPGETVASAACITRDATLNCNAPHVPQFQNSAIAAKGLHAICTGAGAMPILSKCETGFKFVLDVANAAMGTKGSCKLVDPTTTPCTAANKNVREADPKYCGYYYLCNGSTWEHWSCTGDYFNAATKACVRDISVCPK